MKQPLEFLPYNFTAGDGCGCSNPWVNGVKQIIRPSGVLVCEKKHEVFLVRIGDSGIFKY